MLLSIVRSNKYEADTIKDIEDNYTSLVYNVVRVKDTGETFAVLPKQKTHGVLLQINEEEGTTDESAE